MLKDTADLTGLLLRVWDPFLAGDDTSWADDHDTVVLVTGLSPGSEGGRTWDCLTTVGLHKRYPRTWLQEMTVA